MGEDEKIRTYDIPDNFIDESRMLNGMFKTRNFIEGLIMALIAAVPAMLIPASTFNIRIVILVSICGPFFLLGNAGYNGDPISATFRHARAWRKGRGVMLYNANTRALKESPLTHMENTPQARDKLVEMVDSWKNARRLRSKNMVYIEGETFEFVEDDDLSSLYADDNEPEMLDTMIRPAQGQEHGHRKPNDTVGTVVVETTGVTESPASKSAEGEANIGNAPEPHESGEDVVTIEIPDD